MKKIYTLLAALVMTASTFAQAPEKMSYQAVVRDAGNAIVSNQAVGMQLSILQGSTAVYVETQTPTTNANGLVSIQIGMGSVVSGDFSAIDWSAGPYFIKTETDPTGGTTYTITGTSELLSVPFALHATNGQDSGTNAGDMQYWNGSSWDVVVATPNEGATLQMIAGVPTWTGGTPPPPVIGDTYAGGILFHIYEPGDDGYVLGEFHGLVCATTDQSTVLQWSLSNYHFINVATSFTDGSANTDAIIAQTMAPAANTYAAGICRLYSATGDGGLNDWYLPSYVEINLMYQNIGPGNALGLGNIGNFSNRYWSSTEVNGSDAARAYSFNFSFLGQDSGDSKAFGRDVRAVRAF